MNTLNRRLLFITLASLVLAITLSSCGTTSETPSVASPDAATEPIVTVLDGKTLMQEQCARCHTTGRITSKSGSLEEWTTTVDRMIGKGAQLDAVERETLIQYLAQTYP